MQKRSHKRPKLQGTRRFSLFNLILLTLFTLASAYLVFLMVTYQFLNFRSLNLLVWGVLFAIFLLNSVLVALGRGKWLSRSLLTIATLAVGAGIFFARSAIDFSKNLNQTASFAQVELSVVVAANSPLTAIDQVSHLLVANNDPENTAKLLENLQTTKQLVPNVEGQASYQTAYTTMLADGNKAMVLNSAYISLLEGIDPDFSAKVRTLYTMTHEQALPAPQVVNHGDVLNIYISGIDTFGPISSVSRSDVNIIMTVNRKTKKILLTTTPRDAYVPIFGGGQGQSDKLTHAGIYGVDSSIQTLENLYGIDIHYYARLNFTSFIELIDLVGGIEVDNDQEFVSRYGNYHFPAGRISLTADQALGFVRERYSLEHGDADRGNNQMKVVSAVIQKLTSAGALTNLPGLVEQVGQSVQTDLPLATSMTLVNGQLQEQGQYQVSSQAVTGTGSTGQLPSHAMPGAALYMVSLDNASLAAAKQAILDVTEGR